MREQDVAPDAHSGVPDTELALKEYQLRNQVDLRPRLSISGSCDRDMTITISLIDEHSLTRECLAKSLESLCPHLDVAAFPSCDDCLLSPRSHRLILYNVYNNIARRGDEHSLAITKLQNVA